MKFEKLSFWADLTPEQQEQFKKLHKSTGRRGAMQGIKLGFLFVAMNAVLFYIDVKYLNYNSKFAFCGGFLNGCVLIKLLIGGLRSEHTRIKEEVKKIFEE